MSADSISPLRVAVFGAGNFARKTHLPNLKLLTDARVVTVCDADAAVAESAAREFGIATAYSDGRTMLEREDVDVLYSVVPPFARGPVEIDALERGIHLFCEKPQSLQLETALRIGAAVRTSGVVSTVGFRERYRPIWQEARRLLEGRRIAHIDFVISEDRVGRAGGRSAWYAAFSRSGGRGLDWGVHALDLARFITGQDVARAQSFYLQDGDDVPWSWQFSFVLTSGATMRMSMVSLSAGAPGFAEQQPWFTVYAEGACVKVFGYERIELNGDVVFRDALFNPWLEQTRCFLHVVRSGERSVLLNDYADGLRTLAPVLAAWRSAREGGGAIDVPALLADV